MASGSLAPGDLKTLEVDLANLIDRMETRLHEGWTASFSSALPPSGRESVARPALHPPFAMTRFDSLWRRR